MKPPSIRPGRHFRFALLIFIILSLISIRKILVTPGTIGHNWDWFVPSLTQNLQVLNRSLFYTWRGFSLGEPISLWLPAAPFFWFWTIGANFGVGGEIISKSLMITTTFLSGLGMFLFIDEYLKEKDGHISSLIGAVFYGFSPFLFCEFIGGAATQFFSYALLPWFLYFFLKSLNRKLSFDFLASVLFLCLLTISLQTLVFVFVILVFLFLTSNNKKNYISSLILHFTFYILLNSWWILPTIYEFTDINVALKTSSPFDANTIIQLVPSLVDVLPIAGYIRPFFTQANGKLLPIWYLAAYLILSVVISIGVFRSRKNDRRFAGWLLLFLCSLIFATGGKEPLGFAVVWLYKNFTPMSLFRSPQHFILLPTFAFAVILSYCGRLIGKRGSICLLITVFTVFFVPFAVSGNIGTSILSRLNMEHLDVYKTPEDYEVIFKIIQDDKDDFKILFLPMVHSPQFIETEYQSRAQGGDPIVEYPIRDTIVADFGNNSLAKKLAVDIEMNICLGYDVNSIADVLGKMNIKYVILRRDVSPLFSGCLIWNSDKAKNALNIAINYKKILDGEYASLYENEKYLPHFFLANGLGGTFMKNVEAIRINPIKYEIYLQEMPEKSLLVFSESFNKNWKLYENNADNPGRQFSNESHGIINGFANVWEIDGITDGKLTIEYYPQKLFELGKKISTIFFAASVVFLFIRRLIKSS